MLTNHQLQNSFTAKYIKIYLWQGISLILNFASMFIVVPYLTKEPAIYGIYTVCISISIFLVYADLGFVSAGQKYAAECYARNEKDEEIKIVGFISFILLLLVLMLMIVFFYFSYNPQLLLKSLRTASNIKVASELILILACFAPFIILQRLMQIIFAIRLEDYLAQRIIVIANMIKIISVLYFFRGENYQIVGYFLFCQSINAISYIVSLLIAKSRYNYSYQLYFRSIRFNIQVYKKMSNLAFTSLFLMASWILYYEIDNLVIGKYLGVEKVALYAVGFTLLSFFRSIYGILFAPLVVRFNHFIGVKDIEGLKSYLFQIIILSAPVVIIPIVAIMFIAKPFVLSWVGPNYNESINIVRWLILCNLLAFISHPIGDMLVALEKIKLLYIMGAIIPIVYWVGIILTYHYWGIQSFALFKFIAVTIPAMYYLNYLLKFLNISLGHFLKAVMVPILVPIAFICLYFCLIYQYLPIEKDKKNLLFIFCVTALGIACAFVIQYLISLKIRKVANAIISNILSK
jgi:O-antigen/teichoic acid export membrane protein